MLLSEWMQCAKKVDIFKLIGIILVWDSMSPLLWFLPCKFLSIDYKICFALIDSAVFDILCLNKSRERV